VAAIGALVGLNLHRIRLFPSVVSHARHLPRDLGAGSASGNFEAASGNFLGDVNRSKTADVRELIAEVLVYGLEPFGKLSHGCARVVESGVPGIKIQNFGRLDGGVGKVLHLSPA